MSRSNPWEHVRAPDVSKNPYIHPASPPPPPPPGGAGSGAGARGSGASPKGSYILMPQVSTYALGVQALRDSYARGECPEQPTIVLGGMTVPRPLTFKETLEARVKDYESMKPGDERLRLFNHWIDSCTGIAYKAGTTRFKLRPISAELVSIDKDFNDNFLPLRYDSLTAPELDSSRGPYNQLLTKDQVLVHPGWQSAVEHDTALLRAYTDIVFAEKSASQLMSFWVRQNTPTHELRALFVGSLGYNSDAYGVDILIGSGSFLRVAPRS